MINGQAEKDGRKLSINNSGLTDPQLDNRNEAAQLSKLLTHLKSPPRSGSRMIKRSSASWNERQTFISASSTCDESLSEAISYAETSRTHGGSHA